MGFNFQAGHPNDVYEGEHGAKIVALLRKTFGPDVPLGTAGQSYLLCDEMGWSWWSELQAFAAEKLGEANCRQIAAVDAWTGVYLDADVDRTLLWPNGKQPDKPIQPRVAAYYGPGLSWWGRLFQWLGIRRKPSLPPELLAATCEMVQILGARPGERGALQVGNLRRLMAELKALLGVIGVEPTEAAVEALRSSYADDDERVDSDPEIQCLCHAWLTGAHALANGTALWLIK